VASVLRDVRDGAETDVLPSARHEPDAGAAERDTGGPVAEQIRRAAASDQVRIIAGQQRLLMPLGSHDGRAGQRAERPGTRAVLSGGQPGK
jgi:hypothetical protein